MKIVPVVTGSAFKNKGVQTLLDAVVDYLPSPLDVPAIEGTNPRTDEVETREADAGCAVFRFGFQTDGGQASRTTRFRPNLFGNGQFGFLRLQHDQRYKRARRTVDANARQ